jgi:alpha-L-fucosidase
MRPFLFAFIAMTMSGCTGTVFELVLPNHQPVSQIVIMEDIKYGERIRTYNVEGQKSSGEWRLLCMGQSVGHKRILRFDVQVVRAIRLEITSSVAMPQLKRVVVY